MKNNKISDTDKQITEEVPKKKNFKFLKFRIVRPEKKSRPETIIGEKQTIPVEMTRNMYAAGSEDITLKEWMRLAKLYAKQYHLITFSNSHKFWKIVSTHWYFKNSPQTGVRDAITIFSINHPSCLSPDSNSDSKL